MISFQMLPHFAIFAFKEQVYVKLPYTYHMEGQGEILPRKVNVVNVTTGRVGHFNMSTLVEALTPNTAGPEYRWMFSSDSRTLRAMIRQVLDVWKNDAGVCRVVDTLAPPGPQDIRGRQGHTMVYTFDARQAEEVTIQELSKPKPKPTTNPHKEKAMSIPRQSHLLSLLQEDMTTVQVHFGDARMYTYKCSLTMAAELRERLSRGEARVIVAGGERRGYAVAIVMKVDDTPQIDLDAPYTYKWIVDVVRTEIYEETLRREERAMELLRDAERKKQRDALLALVGLDANNPQLRLELTRALNPTSTPTEASESTD